MVDHPPDARDASEPICGGKRMGVADQFDANYSALIAEHHGHGVVWLYALLVRIAEDIAVRLKDGRTANESRPSWMHASDVLIGPDTAHLFGVCARERFVVSGIGGENVVWFAHAGGLSEIQAACHFTLE